MSTMTQKDFKDLTKRVNAMNDLLTSLSSENKLRFEKFNPEDFYN